MKKTAFILLTFLLLNSVFISCKKMVESTASEIENTVDLSGKQAVSDDLAEDVNDVMTGALESVDLAGTGRVSPVNPAPLNCPQITVTPGAFPKTITLDFGTTGCTAPGSTRVRRGIMYIQLSDSLRHPGTTAEVTFNNYYVSGYKKEGLIRWTNQSTAGVRKWKREAINVTITSPTGASWTNNAIKTITQVEGQGTLDPMDDAFTISGNATIVNSAGISRSSNILTPVHKRRNCDHCDAGTVQYVGPQHTAVLDFGTGVCDNQATLTIDGSIVRTITLQ